MVHIPADDVARIRAAKRAIVDTTILIVVATPVGDAEAAKAIKALRAAHRCLNRYLESQNEKRPPPVKVTGIAGSALAGPHGARR